MGSYYAGMMNTTGGSELRHFGILGQKWGIRRFQNADGTLTAAGKERYGYSNVSDRDKKKILKMIAERPRNVSKIKDNPIIKNAASELKDRAYPLAEAKYRNEKLNEDVFHHIYDNKEVYEKWLDKAVDNYMKTYSKNPGGTRDEIKDWYRYDDGDQNEHGVFETYIRESGEPLAKKYSDSENHLAKLQSDLRKETDRMADSILGKDANKMDKFWVFTFIEDAVAAYGPMQPLREWDED